MAIFSSFLFAAGTATAKAPRLAGEALDFQRQLVVFEAEDCAYCKQFRADVLTRWQSPVAVVSALSTEPTTGWTLEKPLFATPTIMLFEKGKEVSRYTGYNGHDNETAHFWQ